MRKLTFELRSPIHQQKAIQAIQQIFPDPTKPIVVTIQNETAALTRIANSGLALVTSRVRLTGMVDGWMLKAGSASSPQH